MTNQAESHTLATFAERVALVVTDLNSMIGVVVNDEVTEADFDDDLTNLFARLDQVEEAVIDLAELFWQ